MSWEFSNQIRYSNGQLVCFANSYRVLITSYWLVCPLIYQANKRHDLGDSQHPGTVELSSLQKKPFWSLSWTKRTQLTPSAYKQDWFLPSASALRTSTGLQTRSGWNATWRTSLSRFWSFWSYGMWSWSCIRPSNPPAFLSCTRIGGFALSLLRSELVYESNHQPNY